MITAISFQAQAAPVSFIDQAAFNAAIAASAQGTDGFDGLSSGASLPSSINRSAGAFGYQASSPSGLYESGAADGFLTNAVNTENITFTGFSASVNAFGANLFGSDFFGTFLAGRSVFIEIAESNGATFSLTLDNTTRSSFFGYIGDSGITSVNVRMAVVANNAWAGIDNLTLATVASDIPEPTSLGLVGIPLLGAAAARRRLAAADRG